MTDPQPKLSHMPSHIRQSIVNYSDIETKFNQREISRDFKFEVDKAPIRYSELKLIIRPDSVQLFRIKNEEGEPNELLFKPSSLAGIQGYTMKNEEEDYEKHSRGDFLEAAVGRLLSVFKHPKVSVGELKIEERHTSNKPSNVIVVFKAFNRLLSLKPFQLRVEKLTFTFNVYQHHVLYVLRYLEPITLKSFEVRPLDNEGGQLMEVDEIVLTEQWRGLERVFIRKPRINISLENWSHLTDVTIRLTQNPKDTINQILETFLLNPKLKRFGLYWSGGKINEKLPMQFVRDRFEIINEKSRQNEDCIRLPYEGDNLVYIVYMDKFIRIERDPFYDRRTIQL